tara:strand:- start:33504 stop:34373 length:870 start_codon:yes stop_codon:yes gene_type:complete
VNDIEKLRNIPMINILKRLNIDAIEKKKEQFWFKADWRNEQTPSVKCEHNLFYDFGEGFGGNTVDFIMKYFSIGFLQAVRWLQSEDVIFSFDPPKQNVFLEIKKEKQYRVERIQLLQNRILIDYLNTRKLNIEICKRYLDEVYYRIKDRKYFGVGFRNDRNHFEIRNKYAKLCLGIKWFTWINKSNKSLIVLESWSDFISLLTLYPKCEKSKDFLILNSLSMLSKADQVLNVYSELLFALDNDVAGSNATENCLKKWNSAGARCKDIRYLFHGSKDINDFLILNTKTSG